MPRDDPFRSPRQCGKTSLVLHVSPEFREISLDDGHLSALAENDPEVLLSQFGNENLIVHYVSTLVYELGLSTEVGNFTQHHVSNYIEIKVVLDISLDLKRGCILKSTLAR